MRPIEITEVGPRDGLQNEPGVIPTGAKVAFVDRLSRTGVREIEVSSFVSPKWVPQLADAGEVFRNIRREPGVIYSALVPNMKGLERALEAGVDKIAVFTAASETFNRKNINASIEASLERFRPVIQEAKGVGLPVRGYVSTAFHCSYEGPVPPERVWPVVDALLNLGVDEVSLGDTIGKASPRDVRRLLELLLPRVPVEQVVLHFHATYGMAVANVLTAWEEFEVYRFDASAGGLGGCPYAPGASGNVATEDVVYALQRMGAEVSVDLEAVIQAVAAIRPHLQHAPHSHLYAVRMRGT
ncbi:MAG: hydroxymethylglutaryl-CoA lyase [Candidatus Hydrothermae bacterium]|nr:hydroxymethylglutaryl-CoA lyase [Candidatus Hydrothermae bacterium]